MINVLNIIQDSRIGGPQKRIMQVASGLKEYNINTVVAFPNGNTNYTNLLDDRNISYVQFNLKRIRKTFNPLIHIKYILCFIPNIFSIIRIIKGKDINIVHVNGLLNLQAAIATSLTRAKLIWHLNDINTPKILGILFKPFLLFLSHTIVVSSKGVEEYYFGESSAIKRNIYPIYAPVNVNRYSPHNKTNDFKNEFNIKDTDTVIGMVGNFSYLKGHNYFLKAARYVLNEMKDVKFIMIGKSFETQKRYFNKLDYLIKNLNLEKKVILTGFRNDIHNILPLFDVFVLPSIAEACPITLLEACASGVPVVATKVGGVPEIVIDGKTGILVPPKNSRKLAEGILYLLSNPETARIFAHNSRKYILKNFTLEKCVKRHINLYESLL